MCLFCGEATVDNLIIEKEQQVHILVTLYNQRVLFLEASKNKSISTYLIRENFNSSCYNDKYRP